MREIADQLGAWSAAGRRVAIATVVRTRRSAPRPAGAKMAIAADGEVAGAVSGGCVEGAVAEAALELLSSGGGPRMLQFGIADADAWDVGLPCGGEIDVFVEEHPLPPAAGDGSSAAGHDPQLEFVRLSREGGRGALATIVGPPEHPSLGRKLLVREHGSAAGDLGTAELDAAARAAGAELAWDGRSQLRELAGAEVFVDVAAPPPRLLIFGAVDYAAVLCRLARATGWLPYVCDPRAAFATKDRFPDAELVVRAWPDEALDRLGIDRGTYVVVLTHDPKLDDAALRIALRSDAAYVGAMGSRRAQERRRERLCEAGLTDPELDRLAAPIGLDLGATSPEETALSIMAEVVAIRNGHEGGRLRDATGRIHEVGA